MLVSLHLPKTAGTSFLALLEAHYGATLLRDYADRPLNRPPWQRCLRAVAGSVRHAFPRAKLSDIECVHGHFMPLKYRYLSGSERLQFVAWFRDPVERLASHYHYWQRSYNPLDAGRLHRRVIEERWDLERFCLGAELQNTYSKFLWGFPLSRFDFVGITEHYASDVRGFASEFLKQPEPTVASENVNTARESEHGEAEQQYIDDADFRLVVEAHHAADVALYRQALARRADRLARSQ
ncbi:MAG: hypothetical protein AAGI88_20625 [Pseudomonadota bacterium]